MSTLSSEEEDALTNRLTVRINPARLERIARAVDNGVAPNESELVRTAIDEYLECEHV